MVIRTRLLLPEHLFPFFSHPPAPPTCTGSTVTSGRGGGGGGSRIRCDRSWFTRRSQHLLDGNINQHKEE